MLDAAALLGLCTILVTSLVQPRVSTWACTVGALGAMIVAPFLSSRFTRLATGENGPVEIASVFGYLLAATVFFVATVLRKNRPGRPLLVGLSIFCVILAGEEASWGQHYLGFSVPAGIANLNLQRELNFHNLGSSQFQNYLFLTGVLFSFVVIPLMLLQFPNRKKILRVGCVVPFILAATHLIQGRQEPEGNYVPETMYPVLWASVAATLLVITVNAERLVTSRFTVRLLDFIQERVTMDPDLPRIGAVLFSVWALYGLRFGSLWDLRFFQSGYPINVDDELLEFFGALLFAMLAGMQLRKPRPNLWPADQD